MSRSALLLIGLGSLAGLFVAAAAAILPFWIEDPKAVVEFLDRVAPLSRLWRLFWFCLIIGLWPKWVTAVAIWQGWERWRLELALSLRWRAAAWLLVLEWALGGYWLG